jgi:hypothetical protein
VPAQHLVAGLNPIAGIEEGMEAEQRVGDRVGLIVEGTVAPQGALLGIVVSRHVALHRDTPKHGGAAKST